MNMKLRVFISLTAALSLIAQSPSLAVTLNRDRPSNAHALQARQEQAAELAAVTVPEEQAAASAPEQKAAAAASAPEHAAASSAPEHAASAAAPQSDLDKAANRLYDLMVNLGNGLEIVTNLEASPQDIKAQTQKVKQYFGEMNELRNKLLQMSPIHSGNLPKSVQDANEAQETLQKALIAISDSAEDANVLKKNYPVLSKTFKSVTTAGEDLFSTLYPGYGEKTQEGQDAQQHSQPQATQEGAAPVAAAEAPQA
ncbi:hypothetical protein BY996DRAFT_6422974 [Phakopsora pachyrhizi]|nr:hypothetical protein BY996DRAFT_6422974 [Phakopsora pachyrhizi]